MTSIILISIALLLTVGVELADIFSKKKRPLLNALAILAAVIAFITAFLDYRASEAQETTINARISKLEKDASNAFDAAKYAQQQIQDEKAQKRTTFEIWSAGNGKHDMGSRRLDGASGRHLSSWYELVVTKLKDDKTSVVVRYQGKCWSNNFWVGARGTFRLKVGGEFRGESVSADCGPRGDSDTSAMGSYALTEAEIEKLDPTKITMTRNY